MSTFWAMVRKELRSVTKEKTIMIAIGIQLFTASFSSVILIGLLSFYDPESISLYTRARIKAGILGDFSSPIVSLLQEQHVRPVFFSSPLDAETAFEAGRIDALLFIPKPVDGIVEMQLFLPRAETRSTVIMMVLKEPLKQFENLLRAGQGVQVNYLDIQGKHPTSYEFLYAIIVPILMFFPAFVAGSMVVDSIADEFENHTLDTLWAAPVSLNQIFGAKIVAATILAVAQPVLWTVLLRFNRIHLQNLVLVLLLAAILAAVNGVASALLVVLFKDRERSQFLYSLLILLMISISYLLAVSPITLMTQLAAGDYFAGLGDVAVYGALLAALVGLFLAANKKLMAIKI